MAEIDEVVGVQAKTDAKGEWWGPKPQPSPPPIVEAEGKVADYEKQLTFQFPEEVAIWLRRWPGVSFRRLDTRTFELFASRHRRAKVHQGDGGLPTVSKGHAKTPVPREEQFGMTPAMYFDEGVRVIVRLTAEPKPPKRMSLPKAKPLPPATDLTTYDISKASLSKVCKILNHIYANSEYRLAWKEGRWVFVSPDIE